MRKLKLLPGFFCVVGAVIVHAGLAQATSINCGNVTNDIEQAICVDPALSELDGRLTSEYAKILQVFSVPKALEHQQSRWNHRLMDCTKGGTHEVIVQCLKSRYEKRMVELVSLANAELPCPELPLIKRESDKSSCVKRWLKKHPLKLDEDRTSRDDYSLCAGIYRSLASGDKKINYVDPVFGTEDALHPSLDGYRKCNHYQPVGLGYDYFGLDENAHGFRLYRLRLNRYSSNDFNEYLYEEESWGSIKNGHSQYVRVEFGPDRCDLKDVVSVSPQEPSRIQTDSAGPLPNWWDWGLNAVISVDGQYYVINLVGGSRLHLIAYDRMEQRFSRYQCNWRKSSK